jgi:hypothetical protein
MPSLALGALGRQPWSDRSSTCDRSRRDASQALAGSSPRSARNTTHRKTAGEVSCHSPRRISCAASQREAEHGVSCVGTVRWWSAEVVSAVGIVPIALDLLRRNQNVLSVLPASRVHAAADILDFSRVAIRFVAAAAGGIIRHVPCRIEFFVQRFVLRGVMMLRRRGGDDEDESGRQTCPSHGAIEPTSAARHAVSVVPADTAPTAKGYRRRN